ncbi:MAG: hypothetical protein FJ090_14775 [Deltaproteobacteria bacterium]|nr:hypothetical protein [Deltaproteobacteria bacterium]
MQEVVEEVTDAYGHKLTALQWRILEELLDGQTCKQVALKLGVSRRHVLNETQVGPVAAALEQSKREVLAAMNEKRLLLAATALDYMGDLIQRDGVDESLKVEVARDLMDRCGIPRAATQKVEHTHQGAVVQVTGTLPDLLAEIRQLSEARRQVVEASPVEDEGA